MAYLCNVNIKAITRNEMKLSRSMKYTNDKQIIEITTIHLNVMTSFAVMS